ncbi:Uncharacterised protein [Mycobacteroides abscessus subsp. massiliense]|uniref:hypothetical protein n=1 Tax=Mycobacteroides abscessus TaxID=36809 RepID=UPI0009A899E1|nr:hypothetical protein [Mycobacteroides abscessus]SLE83228.1 Uncharacterised protein [Mycobacteroides abscessus subsp. massiliense]
MTKDEITADAEAPEVSASSLPNPFGSNAPKLTPPSRSRARQSDPEPAPEAAAVEVAGEATPVSETGRGAITEAAADGDDNETDSAPEDVKPNKSILKMFGAIVGAVLLLSVTVWWNSRPESEPPKPTAQRHALPTGNQKPPPSAQAVEDGPIPVTFSSDCTGQTDPKLAGSLEPRAAWKCPTGGVPFGQVLVGTFPKPYVVTGIKYWAGFNGVDSDGGDAWFRNRLLMLVQFVFNNPDKTLLESSPRGERHEIVVPVEHVLASTITMTVRESAPPPPAPVTVPTAAPPGANPEETPLPNLETLLPGPTDNPDAPNDPNAAAVAIWGFQVIGHPVQ